MTPFGASPAAALVLAACLAGCAHAPETGRGSPGGVRPDAAPEAPGWTLRSRSCAEGVLKLAYARPGLGSKVAVLADRIGAAWSGADWDVVSVGGAATATARGVRCGGTGP